MALNQSQLKSELAAIYRAYCASPRESARKMAAAYDAYAKAAQAAPGKPQFTGSEARALEAVLYPAIVNYYSGTPERIAQAWAQGIQAYWLGPVIQFTGGGVLTGMATAMPGSAPLVPALVAVYRDLGNSFDSCAQRVAAALHAATTTTVVTYLMAGSPPYPLVSVVA